MAYELLVFDRFSTALNLRKYRGKCEHLHGHNWRADLRLAGKSLEHVHRTIHLRGQEKDLDAVAQKTLGAGLKEIATALPRK
jgi:6-pyruvoyltetrahydropterin/6-carboxytetrahydropterin synthase